MKKINKKGFVLAEAIVVAVFVLSLFVFLFSNLVPLVGQYEAHEKYDTIDSVYNTNLIRTMIMSDSNVNNILHLGSANYKYFEADDICNGWVENPKFCKKLLSSSFLNVKAIYITWFRTGSLKGAVKDNPSFPRAFRDYVETLDEFTQPENTAYDKYKRIIVHYNDGTFANLEIKLKEV